MKINVLKFRQVIYTLFIALLLIAAFSIYYFWYAEAKEREINDRAFRTLDGIHDNTIAKSNIIVKSISNYKNKGNTIDSLLKKYALNRDIIIDTSAAQKPVSGIPFFENDYLITFDSISKNLNQNTGSKYKLVKFKVKINDLVEPFLRKDVFDHLIIYKGKKSIYQDLAADCHLDSLLKYSNSHINIQNERYKPYVHHYAANDLFFCGLKKTTTYNEEKFGISTSYILILLVVMFVIGVLFPLVKLAAMDQFERLSVSTILSAWGILILNTSFIFLLLLYGYNISTPSVNATNANLDTLSKSISSAFISDLENGYRQMDKYENYLYKNNVHNNSAKFIDSILPVSEITYNFSTISCLDNTGRQRCKLAREKGLGQISVSDREYFKNVVNNNLWTLSDTSHKFSLESIRSHIDGIARAVISKPLAKKLDTLPVVKKNKLVAVALSTELSSVIDPVLPLGYGFCIMNEQGKVLFHDNKEKNLQENFLDECSNTRILKTAIGGNNKLFTETTYLGKKCKMLIKPLASTIPFFLVIYYDDAYSTTIHSEVLVLNLVFTFILFLSGCIHVFSQQFFRKKYATIKQSLLDFEWIIPTYEKKIAYIAIVIFQLLIVGLMLFFSNRILANKEPSPYQLLYLYVVTCAFTFFVIYHLTTFDVKKRILTNNIGFNISTALLLLFVNIFIFKNWQENKEIILFEGAVIVLISFIFTRYRKKIRQILIGEKQQPLKQGYKYAYLLFLLFWIIIISIIPTFYFYKLCDYFGSKLAFQQIHTSLIKTREGRQKVVRMDRLKLLKTDYIIDSLEKKRVRTYFTTDIKEQTQACSKSKDSCNFCNNRIDHRPPDNEFKSFLNIALSFPFNYIFTDHYALINARKNGDSTFSYGNSRLLWGVIHNDENDDINALHFASLPTGKNESSYCLISPLKYFKSSGALFLLVSVYILLIFLALKFFIEKAFYLKSEKQKPVDAKQLSLNTNIFLITLPNSSTTKWLEEKLEEKLIKNNANLVEIDLSSLGAADHEKVIEPILAADKQHVVLINHFEYNLANFESQKAKIELLEKLIHSQRVGLVVISSLHPDQILEIIRKNVNANDKKAEVLDNYERWIFTFKHFFNSYLPLQQNHTSAYTNKEPIIDQECNNGEFLLQLKTKLPGFTDEEETLINIQELASNYYHSIWNALSEKERYIVHDIAKDGIINLKNAAIIDTLLSKGILVVNNGLRLMNRSFRNFILTEIDETQVLGIENFQNRSSSVKKIWRSFLLLILLLLGLFILSTQKEMGSKLIALIASIGTSLTLLLNLFNSFNANGKNNKEF